MSYSFNGKVYKTKLNYIKAKQKLLEDHNNELLKGKSEIDVLRKINATAKMGESNVFKENKKKIKNFDDELVKTKSNLEKTNTNLKNLRWNIYENQRDLHNKRSKKYYYNHKNDL